MIMPGDLWAPLAYAAGLRQHLGILSWLELDADVTAGNADDRNLGVMGSLGLRFYPVRHPVFKLGLSVGGALGCGGMKATGEDEDSYRAGCHQSSPGRLAGGGYVGLQLGIRINWVFALYAGFRYQLTGARELPLTHWLQYGFGIQFDFPRNQRVFITIESGAAHFFNHYNTGWGGYHMASIGFRYGLWK